MLRRLLARRQLLEKPPEANQGAKAAAQRTIYFMLPLARRGASRLASCFTSLTCHATLPPRSDKAADFGKQKMQVLLLSAKSSDTMAATHPGTKAALEGGAPRVIAQALRRVPPTKWR